MKIKLLTIFIICFALNSFSQNNEINFYVSLKNKSIGQIEEQLTLLDWEYEGIKGNNDYIEILLNSPRTKIMSFSYYNIYSDEIEAKLGVSIYPSDRRHSVLISTEVFEFYKQLIASIVKSEFQLIKSYEGVDDGMRMASQGLYKYGDELEINPLVKIYSNGKSEIRITSYEVVRYHYFKNDNLTYKKLRNHYVFEF